MRMKLCDYNGRHRDISLSSVGNYVEFVLKILLWGNLVRIPFTGLLAGSIHTPIVLKSLTEILITSSSAAITIYLLQSC